MIPSLITFCTICSILELTRLLEEGPTYISSNLRSHEQCPFCFSRIWPLRKSRWAHDCTEALHSAAEDRHVTCAHALVEAGVRMDGQPVHLHNSACFDPRLLVQHVRCLDLLLKAGADANASKLFYYRGTELHQSAAYNHGECIMKLVQAGAAVNARDDSGRTPLLVAAEGLLEAVNALLSCGAGIELRRDSWYGAQTPLLAAVNEGHLPCVQRLIDAGADVNAVSNGGRSVLMICTDNFQSNLGRRPDLTCMKLLLKSGAHVNLVDKRGHNALHGLLLHTWDYFPMESFDTVFMLLFATGENLPEEPVRRPQWNAPSKNPLPTPSVLPCPADRLLRFCRHAVRKHLLHIDPHRNLFLRVHRLPLPSFLKSYLLYDISL